MRNQSRIDGDSNPPVRSDGGMRNQSRINGDSNPPVCSDGGQRNQRRIDRACCHSICLGGGIAALLYYSVLQVQHILFVMHSFPGLITGYWGQIAEGTSLRIHEIVSIRFV